MSSNPWTEFVTEAEKIYPAFTNEQIVRAVLKDKGNTIFESKNSDKMLRDLKSMVNGWQAFLKDAREIDDKHFSKDSQVAKILNSYGIPWYKDFDITEGLNALKDWLQKSKLTYQGWDYPCPICGAPTQRDPKWDYMYRKECNGLGWKCTVGGSQHFHSAAWAPLKHMFVESERNTSPLQEVDKETNGTVIP